MSPSVPELDSVQNHSTANLPYGALPVRPDQPVTPPRGSPDTDALGVSRLNPETSADSGHAAEPADSVPHEGEAAPSFRPGPANLPWDRAAEYSIDEHGPEPSSEVDLATARGDSDDDVHFGVAAKALGVSRKTVERMVKRRTDRAWSLRHPSDCLEAVPGGGTRAAPARRTRCSVDAA